MKFHLIWPLCIDFLFSRRWKWNNALCSPFVLTFGVLQIEGFCSFKAFPLFQRGKMSQIKIGNSMILGFYVTLFSILCFPASPNFPKMSKVPFQGDNRRAPSSVLFLAHWNSVCGIFPGASNLGNCWCHPDPSCTSRNWFLAVCGCHKTQNLKKRLFSTCF